MGVSRRNRKSENTYPGKVPVHTPKFQWNQLRISVIILNKRHTRKKSHQSFNTSSRRSTIFWLPCNIIAPYTIVDIVKKNPHLPIHHPHSPLPDSSFPIPYILQNGKLSPYKYCTIIKTNNLLSFKNWLIWANEDLAFKTCISK